MMADVYRIDGTMVIDVYYHHGRHKWCIDWRFNNMGGVFDFYDTKDDAKEALALFYKTTKTPHNDFTKEDAPHDHN